VFFFSNSKAPSAYWSAIQFDCCEHIWLVVKLLVIHVWLLSLCGAWRQSSYQL